ncbi:hypothetical protein ACQ86E_13870 [Bradyrhizobium betae]|uniref:hypothetical protein n=1 Tax=Bradyrhizobium betae TaxID=244734 RepID=UPI003D66B5B3
MAKQVIVVVHGVGVKQAGVSSDLLAAALQDDQGKSDETRLPPHSSDDFVLLESPRYDTSGKASTFPARVRRYRSYDGNGVVKEERVIADFFWGDVTAFGSSIVSVVLAYFKVAMGLSHAIRENASDVYPQNGWKDRWIRRLARGAALTIHGPIIALNLVLLLGLLLGALLQAAASAICGPEALAPNTLGAVILLRVQIAAVALLAIAAGLFVLRQGRGAFLYRHLFTWIALSGLAFLLLGSPELFGFAGSDAVKFIESRLVRFETGMSLDDFKRAYPSLLGVGWRLITLLSASWLVVFIQAFLVTALGFIRHKRVGKPQAPKLIVPAIGLMSLLWFLLTAALWAAVLKFPAYNLGLKQEAVAAPLVAIGAAVIVIVWLALAAASVLRRKSELARGTFANPANYMADNGAKAHEYADRYRLLIASKMLNALSLFLPLVFATACLVSLPLFLSEGELAWITKTRKALEDWTITIIFGILAVGTLLVYWLKAEFSAGLGILADVLAYLNNSSWTSSSTNDGPYRTDEARQTWLERLLFKRNSCTATNTSPRGYWLRRRIHDRLDVLVRNLIRDEKPDRLDIVSHSQGTMIAIDLIDLRGEGWLKGLPAESGIGLVTMGSPYTHLYGHYFPPRSGRSRTAQI